MPWNRFGTQQDCLLNSNQWKQFNVAHGRHPKTRCVNVAKAILKHQHADPLDKKPCRSQKLTKDTKASMLSGVTRKSNMRSTSYWFTESCNSQCLSHFAAPFIVVRAETSITGSCDFIVRFAFKCIRQNVDATITHEYLVNGGKETRSAATYKPPHHPWQHERDLSLLNSVRYDSYLITS